MVVDTNVGYNKTNAVVSSQLFYDVDLTDPARPASNLSVIHHNSAEGSTDQCDQRPIGIDRSVLEYWYPIDRCYYNYLRVYVPSGSQLKSATPHAVSRAQMIMLDEDVPPRVDLLDDNLQGLQGFGTLLVVPTGQSLQTDFQFSLPTGILESDPISHNQIYQLKIQKQPGTDGVPITIRVHLPQGSQIMFISPVGFTRLESNLLFTLKLTRDVNIRIEFHL